MDIDGELLPNNQTSLFWKMVNFKSNIKVAIINKIYEVTLKKIIDEVEIKLFNEIEIPCWLLKFWWMQFNGMKCNKDTLNTLNGVKSKIDELTNKNIWLCRSSLILIQHNNLKYLFEKMGLTPGKK